MKTKKKIMSNPFMIFLSLHNFINYFSKKIQGQNMQTNSRIADKLIEKFVLDFIL
jgi:hypothetical protein